MFPYLFPFWMLFFKMGLNLWLCVLMNPILTFSNEAVPKSVCATHFEESLQCF